MIQPDIMAYLMFYRKYGMWLQRGVLWVMCGVLLSACRMLPVFEAAKESQLTAMVGDSYILRVGEVSSHKGASRFESCLLDGSDRVLEDTCVNAIRVTDKQKEGVVDKPLLFYMQQLHKSKLSREDSKFLAERQEELIRYQKRESFATYSGFGGGAAMLYGASQLSRLIGQKAWFSGGVWNLPALMRVGVALLVTTSGAMLVHLSHTFSDLEEESQDNMERYDERFNNAIPPWFAHQPAKWLVVIRDFEDIISEDIQKKVKVEDFRSHMMVFSSYLETIGFIPTSRGVLVSSVCFPSANQPQELAMQNAQDQGVSDCVFDLRKE
ncbi:MAG: hypothetical protein OXC44_04450 [Proteobacteria bacterium]|nr:hypothetical protein [Pseudomonadota bacterium]